MLEDLDVYRRGGEFIRAGGRNLYEQRFGPFGLPFIYPPFAAGLFALLAVLSVPDLKLAFTVASLASLLGSVWVSFGILHWPASHGRAGATCAVAAVALWLEPVQQTLQFGQLNLILMALVLFDLGRPDERRSKGALVGIASALKLTPAIFIAYLFVTGRRRPALVSAAVLMTTIVGMWAVLPSTSTKYWFGGQFLVGDKVGTDFLGNQSLLAMFDRLTEPGPVATLLWLLFAGGVVLAAFAVARSFSARGRELSAILLIALAALLVSPISWTHHYVWVAPALCLAAHATRHARSTARQLALAGATAVSVGLLLAWFQQIDGRGFPDPRAESLPWGLIWLVPHRDVELQWSIWQWVLGDAYVIAGVLIVLGCVLFELRGSGRTQAEPRPRVAVGQT